MESKTMKTVFTVVERGPGKSYWTRVGVGFVNQDGSLNLRLDAIPVNGMLQVRDYEPLDRRGEGAAGPRSEGPGEPRVRRREPDPLSPAAREPLDASRGAYLGDALT